MLTVLVKHKATGRDVLYTADCVEMQSRGDGAGLLLIDGRTGEATHIGASLTSDDERDVFVMNGAGATVARYVL